jgi:hypothetical protein
MIYFDAQCMHSTWPGGHEESLVHATTSFTKANSKVNIPRVLTEKRYRRVPFPRFRNRISQPSNKESVKLRWWTVTFAYRNVRNNLICDLTSCSATYRCRGNFPDEEDEIESRKREGIAREVEKKKWGKASWKTDEGVNERKRREVFLSVALSRERKPRSFKLTVSFKTVSSRELVRSIRSVYSFSVVIDGFFGQRAKELVFLISRELARVRSGGMCKDNLARRLRIFHPISSATLTFQIVQWFFISFWWQTHNNE